MSVFGTRKTAILNPTSTLEQAAKEELLIRMKALDPKTEAGMLVQTCDTLACFAIGYAKQLMIRITSHDPMAAVDNGNPSRRALEETVQTSVDALLAEQADRMSKIPRLKKAANSLWEFLGEQEGLSKKEKSLKRMHGINVAGMLKDISLMHIHERTKESASMDELTHAYKVYDLLTADVAGSC